MPPVKAPGGQQQEGELPPDCYAKQKQVKTTISGQTSLHTAEAAGRVLKEIPANL